LLTNTVTKDIISAGRGDYFQTTAQINHGNSGGPMQTFGGIGYCHHLRLGG
jgi:S1-C subfamily serine protease